MNAEDLKRLARTFGPAWLVMIADVDVASIVTGLQAGASFGYFMATVMLLLTAPLFFIQDAAGTLGTVAGLGLGEAIRRLYGRRAAVAASIPMALTDVLEYTAEYAGIAVGLKLLGLPVVPGLLAAFAVHIAVAWTGRYRHAEALLLPVSFALVAALVASAALRPPGAAALEAMLSPPPLGDPGFEYMLAASVGAVVMPWMLFFHSGADARKGLTSADLRAERLETLVGALASEVLMAITVFDGAAVGDRGVALDAGSLAGALRPLGAAAPAVMGAGFIAAGFLALVVISLASAWGVLEALEVRRGTWAFRVAYLLESVPALMVVLLGLGNLVNLMIDLMVSFTLVLAPLLYMLGRIASREDVLGEHRLRGARAVMYWAMSAIVVATGIAALVLSL